MQLDLLTATERAREFLTKSGHLFNRLEKTELREAEHEWRLTFDVGLGTKIFKTVRIDDKTGKVIAFE